MAIQNITQLRRVVFRKWNGSAWSVFTMEPDDLGQDTTATVNVAPRLRSRASAMGSTESPIKGTFDALAGSITFLMDTFKLRPIKAQMQPLARFYSARAMSTAMKATTA